MHVVRLRLMSKVGASELMMYLDVDFVEEGPIHCYCWLSLFR